MKKKKILNIVILSIFTLLVIIGIVVSAYDNENVDNNEEAELVYDVTVEIKGEVEKPGIYLVPKNTIVSEVIVLAKGFTEFAYTNDLNLTKQIEEGMVINVRRKDAGSANLLSLNKATLEELATLPGIANAKALAIISYREEKGGFTYLEELMEVKGISQATFDKIKSYITL